MTANINRILEVGMGIITGFSIVNNLKVGGDVPSSSLPGKFCELSKQLEFKTNAAFEAHIMSVTAGFPQNGEYANSIGQLLFLPYCSIQFLNGGLGGVGRVMHLSKFLFAMGGTPPSIRLQEETVKLQGLLNSNEAEITRLKSEIKSVHDLLPRLQSCVTERAQIVEKGSAAIEILDQALQVNSPLPNAEEVTQCLEAFTLKFKALLSDEVQVARMKNLIILKVALKDEETATQAQEKELAQLKFRFEAIERRKVDVNARLARVNMQTESTCLLLKTVSRADAEVMGNKTHEELTDGSRVIITLS